MKVNEKCECIDCPTCEGDGTVWVSGNKMEAHRFDDMGDIECCPGCGGDGISICCLKCSLEEEEEYITHAHKIL